MADRPRRPDEFVEDAARAMRIVDEAVGRYDDGDDLAPALLAGPLRLLAGSSERLLARIGDHVNHHPGLEAGPPVPDDPKLTLALGALPSDDGRTYRSFQRFIRARCLTISEGGAQRHFTWDELLRDAANKLLLLHANTTISTLFDEIATYRVANEQHVIPFMLRQLGLATLVTGRDLLAAAGREVNIQEHGWATRGMTLHAIQIRGRM